MADRVTLTSEQAANIDGLIALIELNSKSVPMVKALELAANLLGIVGLQVLSATDQGILQRISEMLDQLENPPTLDDLKQLRACADINSGSSGA